MIFLQMVYYLVLDVIDVEVKNSFHHHKELPSVLKSDSPLVSIIYCNLNLQQIMENFRHTLCLNLCQFPGFVSELLEGVFIINL